MVVREATTEDLPEVGRMLHDFNREFDEPAPPPEWLSERVATLLAGGDTVVLVDETVSAVAVLRIRPGLWNDAREAYLAELYVRPHRRGAGLGRAILEAAMAAARGRGCDHIGVGVDEPDTAARGLYAAAGFSPDGTRADAPPSFYLERSL